METKTILQQRLGCICIWVS